MPFGWKTVSDEIMSKIAVKDEPFKKLFLPILNLYFEYLLVLKVIHHIIMQCWGAYSIFKLALLTIFFWDVTCDRMHPFIFGNYKLLAHTSQSCKTKKLAS